MHRVTMHHERLVDSTIERKLRSSSAVLVAGPKFCGKTTTCMRFQKSFVKLNTKQAIALAKLDPKGTQAGESPASLTNGRPPRTSGTR